MNDERQDLSDSEKDELRERLADPVWRLHNLYTIVDKFGHEIPFVPTDEQAALIHAVYVLGQKRHVILKARQMGFSTLIELMILDACYFGENVQASIVDRSQGDASEKLKSKCKLAFEKLGALKEKLVEDSSKTLKWLNGSSINAGKNARGGTNQWLHVSEWGPIAHEDPLRSEEIKTGALPTAEKGVVILETTFKGGKGGHFYELLKTAMETPEEHRTAKDFRFWFFPWYLDKGYTLEGSLEAIPATIRAYLTEKEVELGVSFSDGQKLWYSKTASEQGIFMFREYPTTPEEAMQAPVEGAVYGDIISSLRAKGRIITFEWDRSVPVFSSWDLGWDDSTSVWLFQIVGPEIRIIWHTRQRQKTAAEMAVIIRGSGIPVSRSFLPHDAGSHTAAAGTTYKGELALAGFHECVVVPRSNSIWSGINATRNMLKRAWINKDTCTQGIDSLEAYHTKDTQSGGSISKEPVHDWCIAEDQKVMTYRGEVPIKDIKAGADFVLVAQDKWKRVEALHDNGIKECIEYTMSDGRKIVCTPNHEVFSTIGLVEIGKLPNHAGILNITALWNTKDLGNITTGLKAVFSDYTTGSSIGSGLSVISSFLRSEGSKLCSTVSSWKKGRTDQSTDEKKKSALGMGTGGTSSRTTGFAECAIVGEVSKQTSSTAHSGSGVSFITTNQKATTSCPTSRAGLTCTVTCGSIATVRFLKAFTCIIWMAIKRTIEVATLWFYLRRITASSTVSYVNGKKSVGKKSVYDLTIEHDHAFICEDMLVGNSSHDCDGLRTAAEALVLGLVKEPARKMRDSMLNDPRAPIDVASVCRMTRQRGRARSGLR